MNATGSPGNCYRNTRTVCRATTFLNKMNRTVKAKHQHCRIKRYKK